jgi:hypothetical protein
VKHRSAVAIFSFLCVLAAPASAQQIKQLYSEPRPVQRGDEGDPFYGFQNGQICRRWCLEDRNPCDPVHFKVADGRCADHLFPPI